MSKLTAQLRPDHTGKMVTRWVREDTKSTSATSLPAPKLATSQKVPAKKPRPLKFTERQSKLNVHYGMEIANVNRDGYGHGIKAKLSDELAQVPFTEHETSRGQGGWYRFGTNEVDFYSVLAVARPMDALNLLHRGIRSGDEALEFLAEHGIEHIAGDHRELMDELLRNRVEPQQAAPYLDDIWDANADPKGAADWIKLTTRRNMLNATDTIKDDMLSGVVTYKDLQSMGLKNLDFVTVPKLAEYIKIAKLGDDQNFTVADVARISTIYTDEIKTSRNWHAKPSTALDAVLKVARFHGVSAVEEIKHHIDSPFTVREQTHMLNTTGELDHERLANLYLYQARLKKEDVPLNKDHDAQVRELFDRGISPEAVGNYLSGAPNTANEISIRLNAMLGGIASTLSDGWL